MILRIDLKEYSSNDKGFADYLHFIVDDSKSHYTLDIDNYDN